MPTREPPHAHGSRGDLQFRPPGPGPPPGSFGTSVRCSLCQPQPGAHRARPKKIVFEDELPSRPRPGTKKPVESIPGEHMPRPHPVPDYELSKYPPVSSERERSCYAAVFQDQYSEFLELQQELRSTQAKLQQLEALLTSLPPPHSQDPGFLDKQARCRYLKGKLRHLKAQIQKFDNREDSEGSVYF
ncbi:occludin/ELL domain-containing protein 1 isoform X5 [Pipistrellus kuhlii]|uniref:occludin/ELL domain-containing protein 1 isoform X5 n=1 Tax=Pipistrellus kuhlii TaxID=59472 RepID=UPI00174F26F2|nr:occludin/ELL domain-containing protein 1 isoform X5 [Pipistrellus kuhlii]